MSESGLGSVSNSESLQRSGQKGGQIRVKLQMDKSKSSTKDVTRRQREKAGEFELCIPQTSILHSKSLSYPRHCI